ncbi:MFS drug transporter [Meredithblackwellia eburnea MCA 4105]
MSETDIVELEQLPSRGRTSQLVADSRDDLTRSSSPSKRKPLLTDQTLLLPRRHVIIVFCALSLSLAVAFLDQLIITTALPVISAQLGNGRLSPWVGSTYIVVSAACQPIYGRLGDIMGRKMVLLGSLGIFMIGSLACALAKSMMQLIVFRALQGVGGGGLVTSVWIISSDIVSLRERGTYQSILQLVILISTSLGPLLGGALSAHGWPLIFWINLPIGAVAFFATIYFLPLRPVDANWKEQLRMIDYFGIFLTISGAVLILLGLNWGGVFYAWDSTHVVVTIIVGVLTTGIFVLWEWKGATLPIVPLHTFGNPSIAAGYAVGIFMGSAYFSTIYALPQFYQVVKSYSAVGSGVPLLPLQIVSSFAVMASGFYMQKTGKYKIYILVGLSAFAIGLGLEALAGIVPTGAISAFLVLTGFGMGSCFMTTLSSCQAAAEREDVATVTSIREYVQGIGSALGLAVSGTVIQNGIRRALASAGVVEEVIDSILDDPTGILKSETLTQEVKTLAIQGFLNGFRQTFYFNAGCIVCAVLLTYFLIREFPLNREGEEEQKEQAKEFLRSKGKRA